MVRFVKQSDKVRYPNRSFSTALSNAYGDMFNGKQSTVDIRTQPDLQGLFLEMPTAQTPNYGSGTVVGYKLGLYVNSINNKGAPALAIWKAKQGITKHEGNFGQNVVTDIYSMCSYPSDQPSHIWGEDFSALEEPGAVYHVGHNSVRIETDPYLDEMEAYNNYEGWDLGGELGKQSFSTFQEDYGKELPNGQRVVFVERVMDTFEGNLKHPSDIEWGEVKQGVGEMFSYGDGSWGISTMGGGVTDPEYKWRPVGHTVTLLDFKDVPYWKDAGDNAVKNCTLRFQYSQTFPITKPVPEAKQFVNLTQVNFDEMHTDNWLYYRMNTDDTATVFFESGAFFNNSDVKTGGHSLQLRHAYRTGMTDGGSDSILDAGMSLDQLRKYEARATFVKNNIPSPIVMTKPPEYDGTQALSDSNSNRSRMKIVFNLKIKDFANIVTDGSGTSDAAFPSRGMAIWFKNKTYDGVKSQNGVGEDILRHCYMNNTTNFEALSTTTAHMHSAFCGFILYRLGNEFYVKSLAEAGVGWNFDSAKDQSGQSAQLLFDPDVTSSTNGEVKLTEDLLGKWVQFVLTFDPEGSGFVLNIMDENNRSMGAEVICSSSDGDTDGNMTKGWPIMSVNTNNTGAYQDYTNAQAHLRGNYTATGLTADEEEAAGGQTKNTDAIIDVLFDSCFISKSGSNYKHLQNTYTDASGRPDKLAITHVDVVDDTVTIADGGQGSSIEESTGLTTPVFWSFGTKNAVDLYPEYNGIPKYLWFNGFGCDDSTNNTAIDNKYIQWAYSTDEVKLGQQLWGYNNAGTVDGASGTLIKDTTSRYEGRFVNAGGSGVNRIYHSSAEITADSNSSITPNLSSEHFTQYGHIAYASTDVTDSDSMKQSLVKRENIFCSARISPLKTHNDYTITIDDTRILRDRADKSEEYILYAKDARNAPTNYVSGMKINYVKGNEVTFKEKIKYTDAHTTLRDSNLTSDGGTVIATTSNDRFSWALTTQVKLVNGTVISPLDYFNIGDHITVTGCAQAGNNSNFVIDEIGTTYIGVTGNLTDETIADGNIRVKKRVGYKDILVTDTSDDRYDESLKCFLSPYRYWMYAEIFNYDYTNSDEVKLPNKKYESVVITDLCPDADRTEGSFNFGSDDLGATWNEWLITDSATHDNQWNLLRSAESKGVLITDHDFGYGAYNAELEGGAADRGGYVQKHTPDLTFAGNPYYNIIDISAINGHKEYDAEESVYLWINSKMEASPSSTNISTFHDATVSKRPFLLTVFEDERPTPPVLEVKPYEEDAFLPKYTWEAKDDDLWYGLLFIDNKNIANQYHNALWRLHMNEDLTGYAKSDYTTLIEMIGSKPSDTMFTELVEMTFTSVRFYASSKKIDFAGLSDSGILSQHFKAGDKVKVHHATTDSTNAQFDTEFTVASVSDGTSGHIIVSETVTDSSLITTNGRAVNMSVLPDDKYDGLAGNSKYFTATDKTVLPFKSNTPVELMAASTPPDKFSISCHVVGADVTLSGTDYILYQKAINYSGTYDYCYYVAVNAQGNIVISVQGYNTVDSADTDVVTTLTSASILPTDGETPMHIAFTVDNELGAQNVKLFINGVLEASSGIAADAGSDNTSTTWARGLKIAWQEDSLFVGAENAGGDNGFTGHIEEVVAYSDVIYPVNPKEGEFLWTKPVEDFTGSADSIAPTSYTARLFVKDFHNIRGSSASQVATSGMVSYRKPVFDVRGA